MLTEKEIKKIEKNTLRKKVSTRGGGIEIALDEYGFKGEKMAAYQNYLGGGMLGKVVANDTIRSQSFYELTDKQEQKLDNIADKLKRYFHKLTNPDTEWESSSYEDNQKRSISAY